MRYTKLDFSANYQYSDYIVGSRRKKRPTLMALTRLAVLLATSLADCTKWRFATGLFVLDEARRHVLHRADVCLATMVAADNTCT